MRQGYVGHQAAVRGGVRRTAVPCRLVTSPEEPASVRPVAYKGEPLDSERGPGLGCFRFQVGLLVVLIVLTPLTVAWNWPIGVSAALLGSATQTVGELEDEEAADMRPTADPGEDLPPEAGVRE